MSGAGYHLTERQARVVEILYRALQNGTPEVSHREIMKMLGTPNSKLKDSFRGSAAWGTLVVPGSTRGTYRLNI